MIEVHPSPFSLPWTIFCSPYTHAIRPLKPGVDPYCNPSASSPSVSPREISLQGSVGSRVEKLSDVKGNVDEFGFPANKLIRPGLDSKGSRLRTARHYQLQNMKLNNRWSHLGLAISPSPPSIGTGHRNRQATLSRPLNLVSGLQRDSRALWWILPLKYHLNEWGRSPPDCEFVTGLKSW